MNKSNVEKTKLQSIIYIGDGNLQTKLIHGRTALKQSASAKSQWGRVIEDRQ
jgi:hypothetical protein